MAVFSTNRPTHGSFGLFGRINAFVAIAKNALIEWNDVRMTRKALSALTDRELEDIGLIRGDIDSVAIRT
jgi:uncharacterized protein YjiS (DUF1127 family)